MQLSVGIIVLFLGVCSTATQAKEPPVVTNPPCSQLFRCSLVEDTVWATDGIDCFAFRNPCKLGLANCIRKSNCLTELEVIEKEKCQSLCNPVCEKIKKPVCANYKDQQREFLNRCLMDAHICATGETYIINNEGPCGKPPVCL